MIDSMLGTFYCLDGIYLKPISSGPNLRLVALYVIDFQFTIRIVEKKTIRTYFDCEAPHTPKKIESK